MATQTNTQTNGAKVGNMTGTMHDTSVDIAQEERQRIVAICNQQLANTADLYSQTKQAHWNVKGIHFAELHILFDKMADSIQPYADEIAERATALGGTALGTVRMAAQQSELPEFPDGVFSGKSMLKVVVERWAQYANSVRTAAAELDESGDLETSDLFVEIGRLADKMLWFAEAHLQE